MEKKTTQTEFENELAQFIGSDEFYKYSLMGIKFVFTEGVKYVADTCQAFWFIDVVASHQTNAKVREQEFQTWKLERVKGDKFLVTATDGNKNIIATQKIKFSDFPHESVEFWFENNTLYLPSER